MRCKGELAILPGGAVLTNMGVVQHSLHHVVHRGRENLVRSLVVTAVKVCIVDAPWRHQRALVTLHPRISADDGRVLGFPPCVMRRPGAARMVPELLLMFSYATKRPML